MARAVTTISDDRVAREEVTQERHVGLANGEPGMATPTTSTA